MILKILAIILCLILVIGLHELGHAIAAYYFNVKIKRIAIGFGKPLFRITSKKGIEWVWAILPLGGYVHLLNSRVEPVNEKELQFAFDKKPVFARIIILLAGAFANFLVAFVFLTVMYLVGYEHRIPLIVKVEPQSMAAMAGFNAGDKILTINGQKTPSWQEVGMNLLISFGKDKVPVRVLSPMGEKELSLNLKQWHYQKGKASLLNSLGLSAEETSLSKERVEGKPFIEACANALHKMSSLFYFYLMMLKQVLTAKIPFSVLLGPLGLFALTANSFIQGLAVFSYFIASFSLAVGLINLFPIPGLDGGLIVYALIEKIRKKPVSIAMEILLHQLVSIIAVLLLVQLILNDLQRYIK